MKYDRILPRDLFNEGQLLTSIGFLSLAIHDNQGGIGRVLRLDHTNEDEGFIISQALDGSIYVENLSLVTIGSVLGSEILLSIALYTRCKMPLEFTYQDLNGYVFEHNDFSSDFKGLLKSLLKSLKPR